RREPAEEASSLDGVPQLSDVAGPVVASEDRQGIGGDGRRGDPVLRREGAREGGRQGLDVVAPLAGRGGQAAGPRRGGGGAAGGGVWAARMSRRPLGRGGPPPSLVPSPASIARRSSAWVAGGISPPSSRSSVPPLAASSRPGFACAAPVNAPFSKPNISLSS